MREDHEDLVFDVLEEPQKNKFKETCRDLTREMQVAGAFQNNRHYCVGQFQMAVMTLSGPAIPILPEGPPDDAPEDVWLAWDAELDEYLERKQYLDQRLHILYTLVWDRCTWAMQMALEHSPNYLALREERNGVDLLRAIRKISYSYPAGTYPPCASILAKRGFYLFEQGPDMSLQEYRDEFMKRWEIVETVAGLGFAGPPYLQRKDGSLQVNWPPAGRSEEDMVELATAFIMQADSARFESMKRDLHNTYLGGSDFYPKTVHDAFELLGAWIQNGNHAGGRRRGRAAVLCFRCRQRGHCHYDCPINNPKCGRMFTGDREPQRLPYEKQRIPLQRHGA
jgi:hypothetical protein